MDCPCTCGAHNVAEEQDFEVNEKEHGSRFLDTKTSFLTLGHRQFVLCKSQEVWIIW